MIRRVEVVFSDMPNTPIILAREDVKDGEFTRFLDVALEGSWIRISDGVTGKTNIYPAHRIEKVLVEVTE